MAVKQTNTPLRAKLVSSVKTLKSKEAQVGYFGNAVHKDSGMTYPQLMFLQEVKGVRSSSGRVHRRLFELTAIRHQAEIIANIKRSLKANLISNPDAVFKDFGDDVKAKLLQGFGDPGFLEPNAPSTVAAKGNRNTPLVDTGDLKSNLRSRVVKASK